MQLGGSTHHSSFSNLRPGSGMLLISTIVGIAAFAGMLLFGPTPPPPARTLPTGPEARPWVRGGTLDLITRGDDAEALRGLATHLEADPGFGWGWRIVYQLASRDEAFAEQRELAAARLLELSPEDLNDQNWVWDRRTEGIALKIAGKPDEARAVLADSIERVRAHPLLNPGIGGFLEAAMLALGDQPDAALKALERAVLVNGYLDSQWLSHSPDLDSLRGDPRLDHLIGKAESLENARLNENKVSHQDDQPLSLTPKSTPADQDSENP